MSPAAQYVSPVASRERAEGGAITTDIPARLDRLPWSRFHLLVMVALGVTPAAAGGAVHGISGQEQPFAFACDHRRLWPGRGFVQLRSDLR